MEMCKRTKRPENRKIFHQRIQLVPQEGREYRRKVEVGQMHLLEVSGQETK